MVMRFKFANCPDHLLGGTTYVLVGYEARAKSQLTLANLAQ
jgi:hypothetical protein